MKESSENTLTQSGWNCNHCKAYNKIGNAKFCGSCGMPKVVLLNKRSLDKKEKANLFRSQNEYRVKDVLERIRSTFSSNKHNVFRFVVSIAFCLILTSVVAGYQMYSNVNTIRLSKLRFSDIPLDHPIYEICSGLLGIDAIGFRKNFELAAYESISPSEWNHVLNQASKHLNKKYAATAYFSGKDRVTVDRLKTKLKALQAENIDMVDTSRIQSFYILERTLFGL